MQKTLKAALLTSAMALVAGPVLAQSQGDWTFGVGVGNVNPKSDNGSVFALGADQDLEVDSDTRPIFTIEYFVRDNLGIELLLATPFEHDISVGPLDDVASTKHLPPTLSLNYHFPTNSPWKPYVGLGVNYTKFFSEDIDLAGADLSLEDSWGYAVQAGIDYMISDSGALRFTARYIDIESDVKLNGSKIGTAEIDPIVLSASYVFKF